LSFASVDEPWSAGNTLRRWHGNTVVECAVSRGFRRNDLRKGAKQRPLEETEQHTYAMHRLFSDVHVSFSGKFGGGLIVIKDGFEPRGICRKEQKKV
jgi:hypothetical protein